jgi:type II secretory pathway pseudopilin PulG
MTLIELLIAMAVMLVITTPLVTSFVLTLATTTTADQDTTNSTDAQVLSSYFDHDVANADSVSTSSTCGAASGSATVLATTWLDGATQHVIAYQALPDTQQQAVLNSAHVYRITRYDCTGGGSAATVVARSASVVPVPQCDGTACGAAASTPSSVGLTVNELARKAGDPAFVMALTATRRVTT